MPPAAEKPLDPAQAHLFARMRRFMLVSGVATILGIAVVPSMIGYRVFRSEGSHAVPNVTALVAKGARIVATAVAGKRLVVTRDHGGAVEVRSFDLGMLGRAGVCA